MRGVAQPLHEERQLRVALQAPDADLAPAQLQAVRGEPAALDGRAAETLLDGGEVVDRHHPAQPAAAVRGTCPHGLTERRLVRGRVVEDLDDLEVLAAGEREDAVAGAEARVEAAVDEPPAQLPAEPPRRLVQALGPGGEREVVQLHGPLHRHSLAAVVVGGGGGSAGWDSRRPRRVSNSSQSPTSTAYAWSPISARSSASFVA